EGEPREALALHDGTAPEAAGGRSDLDGVVEVGVEEAGAAAEAEPGGVVGDEQREAEHEEPAPGVDRAEPHAERHPVRYRHPRRGLELALLPGGDKMRRCPVTSRPARSCSRRSSWRRSRRPTWRSASTTRTAGTSRSTARPV